MRLALSAALAAIMLALPALAHHGWGSYDSTKEMTITGVIRAMTYENPHGELRLEATDGKMWRVVLSPPFRMQNRGLPSDRLKVGARATVVGYPHKSDAVEIRAERITIEGQTTELR